MNNVIIVEVMNKARNTHTHTHTHILTSQQACDMAWKMYQTKAYEIHYYKVCKAENKLRLWPKKDKLTLWAIQGMV